MLNLNQLISSTRERVVSVAVNAAGEAELFIREPDGSCRSECLSFQPWLLTAGSELARRLDNVAGMDELTGEGAMRCRVRFNSIDAYTAALTTLKNLTGMSASAPLAPYRCYADLGQQAMMALGIRLFHGMRFDELVRMQMDIECNSSIPGVFCDARRKEDTITLISIKDSRGFEKCLSLTDFSSEGELLQAAMALITQRDPDVIEGHNLFNFDLDYIEKRCKMHRVRMAIGRHGETPSVRASRLSIAEKLINYRRYDIYGRHVVDTYHLVQLADVSKREMESYGLKACAKYYGIAREGRVYVNGSDISTTFHDDEEKLREYCLDDVRETDGLSRIISPSFFYQTQLLPLSYQNCVVRGNATRIDAMLCAAYLEHGAALPSPQAAIPFEGALSEAWEAGVFSPVWHIDVRSLYPSIILSRQLTPQRDSRGEFLRVLTQLRQFRLEAKDAAKQASDDGSREYYTALQSTFKILINSFYGYLGFSQGNFNDYALAAKVTAIGREILTAMGTHLTALGATIIEMDTDGIYFVPPAGLDSTDEMREKVQQMLPEGIVVELDGVYQAMFSYKSKNYALRESNGRISLHGAALRSRGLEPFQRRFVSGVMACILEKNLQGAALLHDQYRRDILEHRLPLTDFLKRENLTQSVEAYQKSLSTGKGRRSAVYELAMRSRQKLTAGNSVQYYVTGDKKSVSVADHSKLAEEIKPELRDENIAYYLDKLDTLYGKLTEFSAT